jgi:hypothetical protein
MFIMFHDLLVRLKRRVAGWVAGVAGMITSDLLGSFPRIPCV